MTKSQCVFCSKELTQGRLCYACAKRELGFPCFTCKQKAVKCDDENDEGMHKPYIIMSHKDGYFSDDDNAQAVVLCKFCVDALEPQ